MGYQNMTWRVAIAKDAIRGQEMMIYTSKFPGIQHMLNCKIQRHTNG
jgi:hypothetical protein